MNHPERVMVGLFLPLTTAVVGWGTYETATFAIANATAVLSVLVVTMLVLGLAWLVGLVVDLVWPYVRQEERP